MRGLPARRAPFLRLEKGDRHVVTGHVCSYRNIGGVMDSLKALIFALFVFVFIAPARADFPPQIVPNSYCYTTSSSSYSCYGPKFGNPEDAAKYGCQVMLGQAATVRAIAASPHSGDPPVTGPNGQGITNHGTFAWGYGCRDGTGANSGINVNRVQALPDCGVSGTVINGYAPATCSGTEPTMPPVSCVNTKGLTITGFHPIPVLLEACYASCMYSAVNVVVTTYNGVDYSSGSWLGKGETCPADAGQLIGGIPGHAQNVGGGGGLTGSDLLGLARETTLQQLLANAQSAAAVDNQNSTILQAIRDNTKAIADKPGMEITDDENFETEYREKVAATPDTHGAALQGLPAETVDMSGTFSNAQGFLNVAGCPAGPSFTVQGASYQFDLSPLCQFAQGLSYIVVALAALTGVKIFIGGVK